MYRYSEAFLISKLVAAAQADPDAGKDKEANKEVAAEMRRAPISLKAPGFNH